MNSNMNIVIEEMMINAGDIEYRNRLSGRNYKRIFDFVVLDLKQYIKERFSKSYCNHDYLTHSGNIYKKVFISNTNKKMLKPLNQEYKVLWGLEKMEIINKYPVILEWYKKNIPEYNDLTDEDRAIRLRVDRINYESKLIELLDDYETKNDRVGFNIRIRKVIKTMDYRVSKISRYNATQIKYYKKDNTTSNRGTTANELYTYEKSDGVKGNTWTLSGMKADVIADFCLMNGLDKKECKKWKYGNYADWVLKKLV